MTGEQQYPWTQGPWTVEDDEWAKRLDFGPGIGWIDNDDIDPIEQAANRAVIPLVTEMIDAVFHITAAETGEDLGYRAEMLDGIRDKLRKIITDAAEARIELYGESE